MKNKLFKALKIIIYVVITVIIVVSLWGCSDCHDCDAPTTPTAPNSFTATAYDGEVVLTWSAPESDGGSAIINYEVSSDNGATWVTANGMEHTFENLINDTLYTFKVRAVNMVGFGPEMVITATPL